MEKLIKDYQQALRTIEELLKEKPEDKLLTEQYTVVSTLIQYCLNE